MKDIIEYYTAGAAQSVLGVNYNELIGFVKNGNIRRYLPAGKKRHVYLKEDVDNLARLRQEKIRIIGKEDLSHDANHPGNPFNSQGSSAFLASR